ncbi:MAG TPA: ABC transporter substrate-binding protein [Dehalococcoidia bacterium]|nr:ABC transporter substrate-binding protein [Dehalococcoidia bacterium]
MRAILSKHRWTAAMLAIAALVAAACSGAAPAAPTAAPTVVSGGPTMVPVMTPTPEARVSARDSVILVTNGEPDQLGAFSQGCSGNVPSLVCEDVASDPLTWIDSTTFEVVPLSGVAGWSQEAPDRWRFSLRDGVTFHNGEKWNAAAAKLGVDTHGDPATAGHGTGSYGFHGTITGAVVDDLTLDLVCDVNCPLLPRTTMFLKFQAPEWWATQAEDIREATTVGIGPYRIVEWRRGVEVELEAFEDYRPNSSYDAQAPTIQRAFQVSRNEELARAAMIDAGEADLAFDIGFENLDRVPRALTGTSNEIYLLVADNIWHPELKKKDVREALTLAIDCETLMASLYNGLQECYGNISQTGTVGITDENSAPYPYDPDRARELLAQAGYDPANGITIYSRQGPIFRDIELWEAVIGMWQEVGVTADLQIMEEAEHREVRRSGCGGLADPRSCVSQPNAPGPFFQSSGYYESGTSNESLDLQRQLLLRTSCGNVNSRVCDLVPGFEDAVQQAIRAPLGPDRTRQMEALATTIHDQFWFIPMFQVVTVYGLSEHLEWSPRYDPRTRINTMSFSP